MKFSRDGFVAVVAVLAATAFLFWPLFWGIATGAPPFFEWDVPEQYWPDLVYLCESLHDGALPYWNPYDRGGYPIAADPQAGLYHPLNWALCAVGGSSLSLGFAEARVVLGFLLCGLFALGWLRRVGADWSGAVAGAVLLMAAPFMRHNWELNLTAALAWLPAMLWAIEVVRAQGRVRDAAWLALAVAGCGWVGSPPALYFAGTFATIYALIRAPHRWRVLLLSAALSFGFLAVVILPGAELATLSVQAGRSFESIAEGHLRREQLAALLWPQPGNHLYLGWLSLAAIPLGYRVFPGQRRLLVVGAVAIALTLGGAVFWLAYQAIPGVRVFRLPHRYEAWLGPVAALCVAAACTRLGALRPKAHRLLAPALALASGVLFAAGAGGPAALLGGAASLLVARGSHVVVGVFLAALILLDVSQAMPAERHLRAGAPPGSDAELLQLAPDTRDSWRYFDEFGISARSGTRLRHRDLRGYQDPLQLATYERVVASLREHPLLAAQLNVRYVLHGPHFIHGWDRQYLPPMQDVRALPGARIVSEDVTELPALPFAYFRANVVPVRDAAEGLRRALDVAPAPLAAIEGWDRQSQVHEPELIAATDVHVTSDEVTFSIDAPSAGVVVVNEAHYPGWTARVDGETTAIHRTNGFVRAVAVPAGHHRVDMRFEPPLARACRWLLLATWLGVALLLLGGLLRDRRA